MSIGFADVPAIAVLTLPVAYASFLVTRLKVSLWWSHLVWAALLLFSTGAWGVLGMSFEDFDKPFPLWWGLGLGVAQLSFVTAIALTGCRLWQVRKSRRSATSDDGSPAGARPIVRKSSSGSTVSSSQSNS